jgi:hypothetical protein
MDIDVEVVCKECDDQLTVLDITDYRPGELTVVVEPCQTCMEKNAPKE